jgi:hypothetical protein
MIITFRLDSAAYIDRVLLEIQLRQILSGAKCIGNCHFIQVSKEDTPHLGTTFSA